MSKKKMLPFSPELSEFGVTAFAPMEGMVMKAYLLLQEQIYSREKELKKWLDQSSGYLMALPPKTKKGKKKN